MSQIVKAVVAMRVDEKAWRVTALDNHLLTATHSDGEHVVGYAAQMYEGVDRWGCGGFGLAMFDIDGPRDEARIAVQRARLAHCLRACNSAAVRG